MAITEDVIEACHNGIVSWEKNPKGLEIIENCDVRVADVTNLPFGNNFFEIVFVLDVLEHVKDLDKA